MSERGHPAIAPVASTYCGAGLVENDWSSVASTDCWLRRLVSHPQLSFQKNKQGEAEYGRS
jgi:hypothetical protein